MKVLCCVLASENTPFYIDFLRHWRTLASYAPSWITVRFLLADPDLPDAWLEKGDCIYVKTKEEIRNTPSKMALFFEWLVHTQTYTNYTFLFRPNLSSFIFWPSYETYLSKLSQNSCCAAYVGISNGQAFPSGAGYTLSMDLVPKILEPYRKSIVYQSIDDVLLGKVLHTLSIPLRPAPRLDYKDRIILPSPHFHVRFKSRDRNLDTQAFSSYIATFYEKSEGNSHSEEIVPSHP